MRILKQMTALFMVLLMGMISVAHAEIPYIVYSQDWTWDVPVEVHLSAAVDTHMPFDADRFAMLKPITDVLSLELVTGVDEGRVAVGLMQEEVLALQYRGNQAQISCMPDVTYQAQSDPLGALLGNASSMDVYAFLGLDQRGETLLTDGAELFDKIPAVFEKYGKRSASTQTISGYGNAAYRYDYTIPANQASSVAEQLLSVCPEGWLREIIAGLSFSGKQTLRMYFTSADAVLRVEYNGTCGPADDLRTVKLVVRARHDDAIDKDYVELTSPAKKGKDKNNLTFERTVETNKKGVRVVNGSYTYTVVDEGVTSIRKGEFELNNAFSEEHDHITGEANFQQKLNGAEKYSSKTFAPDLVITGTSDAPVITGTMKITEEFAGKVTEQALVTIDLKRAEPLTWTDAKETIDLTVMNEGEITALRNEVTSAAATAIVRPLINLMGADAEWFFRELPEDAVQSIIDTAAQ